MPASISNNEQQVHILCTDFRESRAEACWLLRPSWPNDPHTTLAMEQRNYSVVNNTWTCMDELNELETNNLTKSPPVLSKNLGCFTWWRENNMIHSLLVMLLDQVSK